MPKENLIFKLDNLEYQYHHLNNSLSSFDPRLNTTRKLFTLKGKNNIKNLDKKLSSTTLAEVETKLNQLKHQITTNKIYHLEKKLFLNLEKYYTAHGTKSSDSPLSLSTYKHITKSKIIKLCMNKLLNSKLLKKEPPTWVKDLDIYIPFTDAQDLDNPSYVYKTYLSNNKEANKFFSKFVGDKKQIKLFKEFENGMDVFLNINKGKHGDQQEEQVPETKSKSDRNVNNKEDEPSEDDIEEEGDQEGEVDEDALVAQYEGLVALSEDEESGDERELQGGLGEKVDYNEVTDLEPSEEDDDESEDIELDESADEEEEPVKKKQKKNSTESTESTNDTDAQKKQKSKKEEKEKKQKKKIALPALEYGFLDQGEFGNGHDSSDNASDLDDPFFDRPEPTKPKNRKGQRQRRLLWEKKYGKSANHVQKEIAQKREDREKRQKEFEEREEKRQQRVKEQFEKDRTKYLKKKDYESKDFHPSWEAKKVQEEKLKNVKFSGKKVVFD